MSEKYATTKIKKERSTTKRPCPSCGEKTEWRVTKILNEVGRLQATFEQCKSCGLDDRVV